jgi:hypothetical protein
VHCTTHLILGFWSTHGAGLFAARNMTEAETNGFFAPQMRKVPTGDFVRPSRKTNGAGVQAEDTRICVVMVGLPARGKSLIAQKGKKSIRPCIRDTDMTSS